MPSSPSRRHPSLDRPKTRIERAVADLERRLAPRRGSKTKEVEPSNVFTPASRVDMHAIGKRWKLPTTYRDFLTRFSPLRVSIPVDDEDFAQELVLFGASELIDGQQGYAINARTGKRDKDWPTQHLVIGTLDGDPLALDLSPANRDDAPVTRAAHGMGEWSFTEMAPSFLCFIEALSEPGVLFADDDPLPGVRALTSALKRHPERKWYYVLRAKCFVALEKYEQAWRDCETAIRGGLMTADAYEQRGNAALGLGKLELAVADYGEALKRRVTHEALFNRGQALHDLENYKAAVRDFTDALEIDPGNAEVWHARGRSWWSQGNHARAEADMTTAIDLSEGDEEWLADCYLARGGLRCNTGRLGDAMKDLQACLRIEPKNDYAFLFRGNVNWRMGKHKQALTDYEKALAIDRSDPYVQATLAHFLATCEKDTLRDGPRALKLARQAVKQTESEHWDTLAAALAEVGKYAEAIAWQQKAIAACDDRSELKKLRQALAAYESNRPYRDLNQ